MYGRSAGWGATALFAGMALNDFVLAILENWFGISLPDSEILFFGFPLCCTIVGFIAGILYDKYDKFLKECAQADNDDRWLKKIYLKETLIVLLILALSALLVFLTYRIAS